MAQPLPVQLGDVHLAADVLHLVVAGLWIGGLIPLAFMLFVARRGDAVWIATAGEATQRFSALALASVLLLLLSGMVNALVLVGSVSALTETLYGRLLLAKIGLFLLMLGFATVNRLRLTPRITADAVAGLEQPRRITGRLASNSVFEFAFGLFVFAIVGILGTLPPASHHHAAALEEHMSDHGLHAE